MDIEIRNIKLEEIKDAIDIKITGWQTAYRGIIDDHFLDVTLPSEREKRIEKWSSNYDESPFVVALYNNEVVGFARYVYNNNYSSDIDCDCELMAIYIKPEYKFKGIGTKMFNYITNDMINNNKTKMVLWCLKENEPSKKFYTKMGGKLTSEKEVTIDNKIYFEVSFVYNLKED